MFKNYFKTAWRNLWNNRFYSAINITGLALGLAVGIMILLWVQNELGYDSFHRNAKNIYKINSHLGKGADLQVWEGCPAPLAIFCKQSIPEVINTVRLDNVNIEILFKYKDKKYIESKGKIVCADSGFFSIFDFKLLKGNADHPFRDMYSIVINATTASRIFGNEDAMGKVLNTDLGNFTVTGVMEDFPSNSSLQYSMVLPMALDADFFAKSGGNGDWKTMDEDLGSFSYQTYLQLKEDASAEKVGNKVTQLFIQKKGEEAKNDLFKLQPFTERHLVSADGSNSAQQKVRIFLIVSILVLIIACINYVNLSTARSLLRAKEVSVRKIIGSSRLQLLIQFTLESLVLFFLASIVAVILIYSLLPLYNQLSGKHFVFDASNPAVWLTIAATIFGTLALASVYPALLLSSFNPLNALKGKLSFGVGASFFRKSLVTTQFVFSIGLVISTIVISSQLHFIRSKDVGYNREHVLTFVLNDNINKHNEAIRSELLSQPGVRGVTASGNKIIGEFSSTADTYWEGKQQGRTFLIHPNFVDQQFIPLLNLQLAEGNNFTGEKSDSAHFILNEAAVKQSGITNPIGKQFTLWQRKGTIIGVVKDFNYASLKKGVDPVILCYAPNMPNMYIKTTGNDAPKVIAKAEKLWKQYNADFPFSYSFLDDDFNKIYQDDMRTGSLFNVFAAVAIIISCLGLFGLATYTAQVRTKEIGIRKVLGASTFSVTAMLSKDFLKLVGIAVIIASPIAYYLMHQWLQDFVYRISIQWWFFAAAALGAVLIAILTVSFQSIKAALANPVKSLRME